MKGLLIDGVAKVSLENAKVWTSVKINGKDIQELIAGKMAEKDAETSLCKVVISLEPFTEKMTINGETVPVEL